MFPLNRNVAIPDYSTQLETSFWQSRSGTKIGIIDWIPSDTWKPVFLIPVYDPVGFLLVLLQYSQWLVNSWKLKWFCLNSFKPLSVFFYIFAQIIHCCLIYDIIRRLANSFMEQDIELLLLLLKSKKCCVP